VEDRVEAATEDDDDTLEALNAELHNMLGK
jgi:hypothetical protein